MKLSVIVPSLNGQVPESLRRQVEGREDVELVVVTGVSPVGRARNEGLDRAKGEYIAWVDSDDEVADGWLAEILAAIGDDVDVVTIDAEIAGRKGRANCVWGVREDDVSIERLRRAVYRDISRQSPLWMYVTKRRLWADLRFDETARIAEDYLILPHVVLRAKNCRYLSKLLYRYCYHELSLINTQNDLLDAEAIGLWERRLEEAPRAYRGTCLWGLLVGCYWLCLRVALGAYSEDHGAVADNVRRCRTIIRSSLLRVACEMLVSTDVPARGRASWFLRFTCAALDFWAIQRWRKRRRES